MSIERQMNRKYNPIYQKLLILFVQVLKNKLGIVEIMRIVSLQQIKGLNNIEINIIITVMNLAIESEIHHFFQKINFSDESGSLKLLHMLISKIVVLESRKMKKYFMKDLYIHNDQYLLYTIYIT